MVARWQPIGRRHGTSTVGAGCTNSRDQQRPADDTGRDYCGRLDLIQAVEKLNEAAEAVADWRATNTVAKGGATLAMLADHVASLVPMAHEQLQTIIDLSPTLRAAMRQVEARRAQKGGVA